MARRDQTREIAKVVALVLGLLALALITARSARAGVVTVCLNGGDFPAVQQAINAAKAGDTLELCAAIYPKSLSVNINLILRGAVQEAMIIGSQTMTTVVLPSPDATITLADLTLTRRSTSTVENISAANMQEVVDISAWPYTGTFTVTNELNLSGADQVTTIIGGDVGGNVVIVQANTGAYVVNGTFSLPSNDSNVIATLADDEVTALATAVYQAVFAAVTSMASQSADQVTTIVNGDIDGNLVIIQANTTIDVINLTVSLFADGAILSTNPSVADVEPRGQSHVLFIPLINR